jgi:hypothetical protein
MICLGQINLQISNFPHLHSLHALKQRMAAAMLEAASEIRLPNVAMTSEPG